MKQECRVGSLTRMRPLSSFFRCGILTAALVTPLVLCPIVLRADDDHHEKRYRDARHKDEHAWNDREDRAYRVWLQDNHRKYNNFDRLKERDRQAYWNWRHDHSDAQLKIDIR
jgi:hypothetical protein